MSTDNETWSTYTDSDSEYDAGTAAIGPWLEFDTQPFVDEYGWLQWTAINTAAGRRRSRRCRRLRS